MRNGLKICSIFKWQLMTNHSHSYYIIKKIPVFRQLPFIKVLHLAGDMKTSTAVRYVQDCPAHPHLHITDSYDLRS